jgi:hypothetical protein
MIFHGNVFKTIELFCLSYPTSNSDKHLEQKANVVSSSPVYIASKPKMQVVVEVERNLSFHGLFTYFQLNYSGFPRFNIVKLTIIREIVFVIHNYIQCRIYPLPCH